MKYYLIAGEASGDLHASNLMRALQQEDANAKFRFFGGDLWRYAGKALSGYGLYGIYSGVDESR